MPAAIPTVQIDNPAARERIATIIWAETLDLSNDYEVSIIDTQRNDIYELWIKLPDGSKVSRNLQSAMGDLTPAVFRIRLRELFKLLYVPQQAKGSRADSF